MADEQMKAGLTTERGQQAAGISDPSEKKAYIAGSANVDKDYEGTAEETSRQRNKQLAQDVSGGQYQVARDARK